MHNRSESIALSYSGTGLHSVCCELHDNCNSVTVDAHWFVDWLLRREINNKAISRSSLRTCFVKTPDVKDTWRLEKSELTELKYTSGYFRNTGAQCRSTKETENQYSGASSAHSLVHTSAYSAAFIRPAQGPTHRTQNIHSEKVFTSSPNNGNELRGKLKERESRNHFSRLGN